MVLRAPKGRSSRLRAPYVPRGALVTRGTRSLGEVRMSPLPMRKEKGWGLEILVYILCSANKTACPLWNTWRLCTRPGRRVGAAVLQPHLRPGPAWPGSPSHDTATVEHPAVCGDNDQEQHGVLSCSLGVGVREQTRTCSRCSHHFRQCVFIEYFRYHIGGKYRSPDATLIFHIRVCLASFACLAVAVNPSARQSPSPPPLFFISRILTFEIPPPPSSIN